MEEVGANPYSAPGIVPGFLGVILFCLSNILLVRSIRQDGHSLGLTWQRVLAFLKDESSIRVFLTLIISGIYGIGLLGNVPYLLATFVYVMVFIILFEYSFHQKLNEQVKIVFFSFVQALLTAGTVAAVFRYLFLVKLP